MNPAHGSTVCQSVRMLCVEQGTHECGRRYPGGTQAILSIVTFPSGVLTSTSALIPAGGSTPHPGKRIVDDDHAGVKGEHHWHANGLSVVMRLPDLFLCLVADHGGNDNRPGRRRLAQHRKLLVGRITPETQEPQETRPADRQVAGMKQLTFRTVRAMHGSRSALALRRSRTLKRLSEVVSIGR